jgi:hypothetical protein
MDHSSNILGFFVSITMPYPDASQAEKDRHQMEGDIFRSYIWGDGGVRDKLNLLKHSDYGKDIVLALFQYKVNPLPIEIQSSKPIESYRKKEKSIGMTIIVNEENFFSKKENERKDFIKMSILHRIELLEEFVTRKKLDTNILKLKRDVIQILDDKDQS